MPCQPRPEAEEEPQGGDTARRLWTIERFPMDARHSVAQKPYGAYAVGEVCPFTYQGQLYHGRVIERLVSRAEGLMELHVQVTPGQEHAPEGESR